MNLVKSKAQLARTGQNNMLDDSTRSIQLTHLLIQIYSYLRDSCYVLNEGGKRVGRGVKTRASLFHDVGVVSCPDTVHNINHINHKIEQAT